MREDIKIDGIPIQDYGTPNSRSCYPGEIQIGETIKSNIDYWRNKYLEENDKNNNLIKQLQKQNAEIENIADQLRQEKEKNSYSLAEYWKNRYEEQLKYGNKVTLTGEAIPNVIDMLKKDYISKDKIKEKYLEMEQEYARKVYDNNYNRTEVKKEEMYKRQVYEELLEEAE